MRRLARETEAKFLVKDPSVCRTLKRLTTLGPFRLHRKRREVQTNVYWDTPDLRLRRARAALKLRTIGSRGELTFKREVSYRGGVSERIEVTVAVAPRRVRGLNPRLDLEPVRRARQITGRRPWERVLTLKTVRDKRIFTDANGKIELDIDRVSVLQGRSFDPVRPEQGRRTNVAQNRRLVVTYDEVELENLDAPEAAFRRALAQLRRRFAGGLRPSRLSKYEIGLRLRRTWSKTV